MPEGNQAHEEALERRLRRLERRLVRSGRWQRGLALLLLLQFGLAAAATEDFLPEVLRAKKIEVIGPDGARVLVLSADENGDGGLGIYDHGGRPIVSLEADQRGAGAVHVIDPHRAAATAAFIGVDAKGQGLVGVHSARGEGGASLGVGNHNDGELKLFSSSGNTMSALGGDSHGAGLFRLFDRYEHPSAKVGLSKTALGEFTVFDREGEPRTVKTE